MAETKDQIEAQRDDLLRQAADQQAEIERLQGELAAARAGGGSPARVTLAEPVGLSEGDRQALRVAGVVTNPATGKLELASDHGIEVVTVDGRAALERAQKDRAEGRGAIRGVDFVYPSVAPGVLAPEAVVRGAQPASAVEQSTSVQG